MQLSNADGRLEWAFKLAPPILAHLQAFGRTLGEERTQQRRDQQLKWMFDQRDESRKELGSSSGTKVKGRQNWQGRQNEQQGNEL